MSVSYLNNKVYSLTRARIKAPPVMLLLDEFANLGRLDELDEISKALGLDGVFGRPACLSAKVEADHQNS
jgi:2-keto-3-deoxy-L-rhamnonate aldolase RhmA